MKIITTFLYNRRFLCLAMLMLTPIALIGSMFTSTIVQAAGGKPFFSLQPAVYNPSNLVTRSYFILDLKPNTSTPLSFRVINSGTATGTVNLYAVDATTSQNSGVTFRSHNEPRTDASSWITLQTSHLTLAAGQSQIVPFKLTIPSNVRPGQHLAGIRAEEENTQQSTTKNGHFQVTINNQFVMAVQVNLPGPAIEQLAASNVQSGGANGYQNLQVQLSNTGTMMVKGNGSLHITTTDGTLLQNVSINLDIILPDTAINYPIAVQHKALQPGNYLAKLDITYGHNHLLQYVTRFTITQAQVNQVFQANDPLQAPNNNNPMPLWQIILVTLAAAIVLLLGGQKLYALISVHRRKQVKRYS